ncbi:MAG: hypothetical protein RLY67_1138 [Pseudomonadota bacterium]
MAWTSRTPALDLRALEISGSDALGFLQGQLTNDVASLAPIDPAGGAGSHHLTGYCSPKGRLFFVGRLIRRTADSFWLLLPSERADFAIKRLKMFVLRSKVTIQELPLVSVGLLGVLGPESAPPQGYAEALDAGILVCIESSQDQARGLFIAQPEAPEKISSKGLADLPMTSLESWSLSEIGAGVPNVSQSSSELFVPQTINLDLVAGVSFTKGCYPGQEVVARTHYLGRLKRRMFRVEMRSPHLPQLLEGSSVPDIWSPNQPDEPCGRVIQWSTSSNEDPERVEMLIECELEAWKTGGLKLGTLAGPALLALSLPYSVPLDVTAPPRPKLS